MSCFYQKESVQFSISDLIVSGAKKRWQKKKEKTQKKREERLRKEKLWRKSRKFCLFMCTSSEFYIKLLNQFVIYLWWKILLVFDCSTCILSILSRVSVRGVLTGAHNKIARTQVEAPNSKLYPISRTYSHRRPRPRRRKGRRANRLGFERQLPSNTEIGSSESGGVERKDATRRLTRAWEPGHLMRLSLSHLTCRSREAW